MMLSRKTPFLILLSTLWLTSTLAQAQVPQTRLNAVSPPGGQLGQTFDLTISSGQDLDSVDRMLFSHPGITAKPKLQEQDGKQVPVTNVFVVTIANNVPVGQYEVRANGYFGVSNPRTFVVSDRPEIMEQEANNTQDVAQQVDLGTIVNGVSNGSADVDFYKFTVPGPQRLVISAEAQRIDSRAQMQLELFNASGRRLERSRGGYRGDPVLDYQVPAAGEYLLRVTEFSYRGGADYFYRLHMNSGPHLDFILPPSGLPGSNGQYTLYGRNLPGGQPSGLKLDGAELEKLTTNIQLPNANQPLPLDENVSPEESSVPAFSYRLKSPNGTSNAISIHLADAPVLLEQEPNNEAAQAQKITIPAEVGGQFQERLDADWFEFTAKAGEVYGIEVCGNRLGKASDPRYILDQVTVNDKGEEQVKRITDQDDQKNSIGGDDFNTRHRDPVWLFAVPADGTYRLMLSDRYRENRGHPNLVYRLVIRKQAPEFRLVAFASTPNPAANQPGNPGVLALRKGDNAYIDILAHRQDGFDGTIEVSVEGLPAGVTCPGAVIGPLDTAARLILTAAPDAQLSTAEIRVVGESLIEDPQKQKELTAAVAAIKPAEDKLPNLQKAVEQATPKVQPAQDKLDAAKKQLADKPDDENLKKQVAQAEEELKKVQAELKAAQDALTAGQQEVANARKRVNDLQTQLQQTAKKVVHPAQTASLIWPTSPNTGEETDARLTRNLMVSVMDDTAEFQTTVTLPQPRVEVSQSSQVLVPVKVERREGFDNNVTLTFAGFDPRSKLQVENKPLNKGENEGVRRIFIPKDSPPGAYTIYLNSQAQVSFERNPQAIAAAKKEQDDAEAQRKATEETNKQAVQAQQKADADLKAAEQKAKTDTDALTKAQAEQKSSQDAVTNQQKLLEKAQADFKAKEAELKTAQDALNKAKAEAAQDTENQDKAKAVTAAEQNVQKVSGELENLKKAVEAENTKLTAAQTDLKTKTDAVAKADTEKKAADTALATAKETKTKADADAKAADAAFKAATAAKTKADQNLQNVTNVNKAKNINLTVPSSPVVLIVKEAPFELNAGPPNGGNLKKGEAIEIKVTVKRIPRFDGPINVTLPLPPGVAGLKADPLTIPPDQTEGVLKVTADGTAPDGKPEYLVIRGEANYLGKASVDAPLSLNLTK